MVISAYYYNDLKLKFLSSFQLPRNSYQNPNQENGNYLQAHSSVAMTLNSRET
jgi:hypothetical protein